MENRKVLMICSEDPREVNNGVSAALNTYFRSLFSICNVVVDIYIHNERKLVNSSSMIKYACNFTDVDLTKYDLVVLSPVNIAFRYLFSHREIRSMRVYSLLSDTYSYALIRNFILGLKFNKFFIKYLLKTPLVYIQEKFIDYFSDQIFLQTSKDVKIFSKYYFTNKAIAFPNSPYFNKVKTVNLNRGKRLGWIVSCTEDYFPLSKWVFNNIVVKVLKTNPGIKLHIHGKNSDILKEYINKKYSKNNFNIIYTEFIDDISNFYLRNKIILSPVYKGYGLINRTIEGMYYGCIVIGDIAAFNGIRGAQDGVNCFIASNNGDFIKKIEYSYHSTDLDQISINAREMMKSKFDITNNINILRSL